MSCCCSIAVEGAYMKRQTDSVTANQQSTEWKVATSAGNGEQCTAQCTMQLSRQCLLVRLSGAHISSVQQRRASQQGKLLGWEGSSDWVLLDLDDHYFGVDWAVGVLEPIAAAACVSLPYRSHSWCERPALVKSAGQLSYRSGYNANYCASSKKKQLLYQYRRRCTPSCHR